MTGYCGILFGIVASLCCAIITKRLGYWVLFAYGLGAFTVMVIHDVIEAYFP
jgi:hypothetical protein